MSKWQPIETAPKDGTRFIGRGAYIERYTGVLRYLKRKTWWGKTSDVPLYGWCHGRVEDVDLWEPTHWSPAAVLDTIPTAGPSCEGGA